MGLGNLFKAVIEVATLPVDVLKDVSATLMDEPGGYTGNKIDDIANDLNDLFK